ncbi:MAG TPA: polysaccharide biosynthesis protein, partial [Desulfosporosinus sp.]|nr:polysaccharide biosynthesis protein [Desulfosporosinus sp.]
IRVIGTRHGEKLYETLLTREEMAKAEDHGGYYRIIPDDRDLNYGKYFTEGQEQVSLLEDYNSHNTQRLSVPEIKKKLMNLEFIQQELSGGVGCAY